MALIIATDRDGSEKQFEAPQNVSLMEALRDTGGMDVAAICGGACSCATCHVYIAAQWLDKLPVQQVEETELLEFMSTRRDGSRLSCQIQVNDELDGLVLELAAEE